MRKPYMIKNWAAFREKLDQHFKKGGNG